MRGHVARKGKRYYPVIDLGMRPAQRCTECGRRAGWLDQDRFARCPRCAGALTQRDERRQQWHEGHDRKKDAERALNELLSKREEGMYVEPSKQTLLGYLTGEWLPSIRSTVRPSTLLSYSGHVEHHIGPRIGSLPLQKLTPSAINSLYATLLHEGRADRTGGLSPATVRRIHATLHRALKDAVRWNKIARNPADSADPPSQVTDHDRGLQTWTAPELRSFLTTTAPDRLGSLWHVLASTGVRRGEVLGLRWQDVDLDAGRLAIRQTLITIGYELKFSSPKTKRSTRQIAIDPGTVAVLRSHRARQLEERMAWGPAYTESGLVFTREDGSPIHPDRVSKMFNSIVEKIGLPRIRLHDLRHTHATLALQAGIHPKVVSERLGHATVSITLDTYSHVIPAMQEDAADRVASLVFGDGQ